MKKRQRKFIETTFLRRMLWACAIIWFVLLIISIIIYSAYKPLKLVVVLVLLFLAVPIASAALSLLTVAIIALIRKWEI